MTSESQWKELLPAVFLAVMFQSEILDGIRILAPSGVQLAIQMLTSFGCVSIGLYLAKRVSNVAISIASLTMTMAGGMVFVKRLCR